MVYSHIDTGNCVTVHQPMRQLSFLSDLQSFTWCYLFKSWQYFHIQISLVNFVLLSCSSLFIYLLFVVPATQ